MAQDFQIKNATGGVRQLFYDVFRNQPILELVSIFRCVYYCSVWLANVNQKQFFSKIHVFSLTMAPSIGVNLRVTGHCDQVYVQIT